MAKVKMQTPNQAVLDAQARRQASQGASASNIEWYIKEVSNKITMTLEQRMRIAVEYLRSKTVKNISIPVVMGVGPLGGKVVIERSKPGEYPRAETTMLMKTLFGEVVKNVNGSISGYVGTPMHYAIPLELELDRSFLLRTFVEEKSRITRLLTGPIV